MSNVNRRDVVKFASAAGIAAAIGLTAQSDAKAQDSNAKESNPKGWGDSGDQSFKVTTGNQRLTRAMLGNNCGDKKDEIDERFDVTKFGSCFHPTPVDADVEAAEKLVEVIADGGVLNTEFGHRTVKNTAGPISYNTYLAYAGGDTV